MKEDDLRKYFPIDHTAAMPDLTNNVVGEQQKAAIQQSVDCEYSDLVGYRAKFGAALMDLGLLLRAVPAPSVADKCEHGVLWSMECIACPPQEYAPSVDQPKCVKCGCTCGTDANGWCMGGRPYISNQPDSNQRSICGCKCEFVSPVVAIEDEKLHSVCTFKFPAGERLYSSRTGTIVELLHETRVIIKESSVTTALTAQQTKHLTPRDAATVRDIRERWFNSELPERVLTAAAQADMRNVLNILSAQELVGYRKGVEAAEKLAQELYSKSLCESPIAAAIRSKLKE